MGKPGSVNTGGMCWSLKHVISSEFKVYKIDSSGADGETSGALRRIHGKSLKVLEGLWGKYLVAKS